MSQTKRAAISDRPAFDNHWILELLSSIDFWGKVCLLAQGQRLGKKSEGGLASDRPTPPRRRRRELLSCLERYHLLRELVNHRQGRTGQVPAPPRRGYRRDFSHRLFGGLAHKFGRLWPVRILPKQARQPRPEPTESSKDARCHSQAASRRRECHTPGRLPLPRSFPALPGQTLRAASPLRFSCALPHGVSSVRLTRITPGWPDPLTNYVNRRC